MMLFALTGERPGTARISREGGRLRVEVRLSGGVVPEGTAAVLSGGRVCLVELGRTGKCSGEPEALLIIGRDGRVLAEGGFAGKAAAKERTLAEARVRLGSTATSRHFESEAIAPDGHKAAQDGNMPDAERAAGREPPAGEPCATQPAQKEPIEPFRLQTPQNTPQSEALKAILTRAQALFEPLSQAGRSEKPAAAPMELPVLQGFPEVRWKRVEYPGTGRYYLEGMRLHSGARVLLHAVPGEYSPSSPIRRRGFTVYTAGSDGLGYWVRSRWMQ